MAKITDLGLSNEKVGGDVDLDNLPKTGGFLPLLQPGRYRFKLPANLNDVFDKVTSSKGERITAIFDQHAPLQIVQAPPQYKDRVGEPFQTRISNVERARGKDKIEVSDFDYLLRAVGHKTRPKTNVDYAKALLEHAGQEFDAAVEVQYSCNPNKDIYADDGNGGTAPVEGQKGCGARYYQNQVQDLKNPDGTFPERITCSGNDGACAASLRAFSQLGSIG